MADKSEKNNLNRVNFGEALVGKKRLIDPEKISIKRRLLMLCLGLIAIPTLGLFTALAESVIENTSASEKLTQENTIKTDSEGKADSLFQNLVQFLNEATNKVETVKLHEGEKGKGNEDHKATCYLAYNTKLKAWERDPDLEKYVEKAKTLGLSEKNCFRILTDRKLRREQVDIKASGAKNSSAGSACIEFLPSLKKQSKLRYEDYVEVNPIQRDLVMENRNGQLCIEGLSLGKEYEFKLLPGFPGGDDYETDISERLSVYLPNREPIISFRERGYILPSHGPQTIPIDTINTTKARVVVIRIPERNLIKSLDDSFLRSLTRWEINWIKTNDGSLLFDGEVEFPVQENTRVTSGLQIKNLIGEKTKAGLYIIAAGKPSESKDDWAPDTTQWFVVNDIGTSLFHGPDGLYVLTRSLETAEILSNVTVTLITKNNRELAQEVSDTKGAVFFPKSLLNGSGGDTPALIRTASPTRGFGFISLKQKAFDLRDRGVAGREVPDTVDAFMYTERGVYRPGETIFLNAIVRNDRGVAFDENIPLTLRIVRPDGLEVNRYVLRDNGGAAYSKRIVLDQSAHMGEWHAYLHVNPDDPAVGRTSFQVNDFVPPKIEVKASGSITSKNGKSELAVDVAGKYLFGSPADGLDVKAFAKINARRQPYKNWNSFFFGLEEEKFSPIKVELDTTTLDETGKAQLFGTIEDFPDTTVPLEVKITTQVFELGGRAKVANFSLPLKNLDIAIGIDPRFENDRVQENSTAIFEIVTLDRAGNAIPAKNLKYRLLKEHRRYTWFRSSGGWDYEVHIKDEELEIGSFDVPKDKLATIQFQMSWGAYRLELTDPKTLAMTSYRFSAGWGGDASGPDRPDNLQIKFDKENYSIGEMARIFVAPPFSGKLVLAVVGKELEFIEAGNISAGGKTIETKISERWSGEPGVYIMPLVYRPAHTKGEQNSGRALGLKWMPLDVKKQRLELALNSVGTLLPGQKLDVKVKTINASSETYVSVAAVDDGVLGLTDYTAPDPFSYFFSQRLLAYEIRDTYGYLINPYETERSVLAFGGDEAADRLDRGLTNRSSRVISLFSGVVKAGADGIARLSFDIPQFSGRLRLMAVAWNKRQVGHIEKTVTVSEPVVSELVLPRFLAPGDKALATASFHNIEGVDGEYKVTFSTDGPVDLGFQSTYLVDIEKDRPLTLSIPLNARAIGSANIYMDVSGPGNFRTTKNWKLSVRPAQPYILEKSFGILSSGERHIIRRDLLRKYVPGTAKAFFSVGSIPSFGSRVHINKLKRYPYRCLEQTTSRGMGFLFGTGKYPSSNTAHLFPVDLKEQLAKTISRLAILQRHDGSFGLWSSSDNSEKWLSVYATDFLTRANEVGFYVPKKTIRAAVAWLRSNIRGGYFKTWEKVATAAYSHYVLARIGEGNIGKLRHFYDNYRDEFPSATETAFMVSALDAYGDVGRSKQAKDSLMEWTSNAFNSPSYIQYDHYSSPLREIAATLHIAAENDIKNKKLISVAESFSKHISERKYFSTHESAWISMAALSIERWASKYQVVVNDNEFNGPTPTNINWSSIGLTKNIYIQNTGRNDATYGVSVTGVVRQKLPRESRGFTISRKLLDLDGNELKSNSIRQGDTIIVQLSGSVKNNSQLSNWDEVQAMVIDLLPAGFEIEAANLSDYKMHHSETDKAFVKGRDDRYVAALNFSENGEFYVTYLVRAVTKGNFVFPAPYIENMYRPDRYARGEISRIEIKE